ncbi:MAG: TonB-dependent receptor [Puniceicoccaceae bacterium]
MPLHRSARLSSVILAALCWLPVTGVCDIIMVRAIDELTGSGIAEASLVLSGHGKREESDASGWIQVEVPEPGIYDATISAGGYTSRRIRLELHTNAPSSRQQVFLKPIILELDAFEVNTELTDEDKDRIAAREAIISMNQISGEELQDVANESVADALGTVAGVNINKEDGNVQGINIRGAGAKQTRITVDGQSAAGGGGRGTTRGAGAVSQIPREFLSRVEVMKAPTPDKDADAIGGTIDMQTTKISSSNTPRTSLALRHSFAQAGETWGHRINIAHAQPFQLKKGRKLGMLLAVNFSDSDFNTDLLGNTNQWRKKYFPATKERIPHLGKFRIANSFGYSTGFGLVFNADLQLSKNHHYYFKALRGERDSKYSSIYHSYEFQRGKVLDLTTHTGEFSKMSLEQLFSERESKSTSGSMVLGGSQRLGKWLLEESIGFSFATTDTPVYLSGSFKTGKLFDGSYDLRDNPRLPTVSLTRNGEPVTAEDLQDPSLYRFSRYYETDLYADDAELAMIFNATRRWTNGKTRWMFKGGLKTRMREAETDQERMRYNPIGKRITIADVPGAPHDATVFRDLYSIGPTWDPDAMQDYVRNNPDKFYSRDVDIKVDSFGGDYSVKESIYASYAMLQRRTDKWTLVSGLRLERTDSVTKGYETIVGKDEQGNATVEINEITPKNIYYRWFPGGHFLYRPNRKIVVRGSLTRTLQRPDFRDLSPSTRVYVSTKRIRSGNPELRPFDAKAADFGIDFVINKWSSASVGVFYKYIEDFIVDVEEEVIFLEQDFTKDYPVNGSPAELTGLECAWSWSLGFLPAPLDKLSLSANYTITDSTADYPGHEAVTIMLPDQVKETLNASVRWSYKDWSISVRSRFKGVRLSDLIEPGRNEYDAGYWSHSASLSYKLNDAVSFSLSLSNLNRPDRYTYLTEEFRMTDNREGSRSASLGINIRWSPKPAPATSKGEGGEKK